ncbi:hypothetical protein BGW38_000034 [Lunasporangiospora selenospora]|uniref:Uncharacterized protein n=1 Tax=Lunasporangiospora selenospora TaxID=979761 RepID=A0A9P6G1R3_9FUNG|nr:hypothetical protein BGW38_000034 [Lunasporangiospora selenospora]
MTKLEHHSDIFECKTEATTRSPDFTNPPEQNSPIPNLQPNRQASSSISPWPFGATINARDRPESPLQFSHPTIERSSRVSKDPASLVTHRSFQMAIQFLHATMTSNQVESMAKLNELLEKQTLGNARFNFLQNRIETLLADAQRLPDSPSPRLFIILPVENDSQDRLDSQMPRLRLYFLCECGVHSENRDTTLQCSTLSNKFHLVAHEGYEIRNRRIFLDKFGAYVRLVLQVFKYGFSAASMEIPPLVLASLIGSDDCQSQAVRSKQANFGSLITKAITIVESCCNISLEEDEDQRAAYMGFRDTLSDTKLRHLPSFLVGFQKDEGLANLYRTVTKSGHVKWICQEHHSIGYSKVAWAQLLDKVQLHRGHFSERDGCIQIKLPSRESAAEIFKVMEKAQRVIELNLKLDWDVTFADLELLETRIRLCNISTLLLDGSKFHGPTSDFVYRNQRFDPLISMMTSGYLLTLELLNVKDLFKRVSRIKKEIGLSGLRYLSLENCDPPKGNQMDELFESLPKLEELLLSFEGMVASYVHTELFSTSAPSSNHVYHLSIIPKSNERNGEQLIPGLFTKNLAYLTLSGKLCSDQILAKVLFMNPHLEGITVNDVNKSVFDLCYRVTNLLRTLQHSLKSLVLCSGQYNDSLTVYYNQGMIEEANVSTEKYAPNGISFRHFPDTVDVKIEKGDIHLPILGKPSSWATLDQLEKETLNMVLNKLPSTLSLEIQCFDLQETESFKETLALALAHPKRLSGLDLSGKDIPSWLPHIQPLAENSDQFTRLRSLWFDYGEALCYDLEVTLIQWLLSMLSSKDSKRIRDKRMQFVLGGVQFSSSGWDMLLQQLDFYDLRVLSFDGVNMARRELEALKVALPDDFLLEVWLHNIQTATLEELEDFQNTFQQTLVRTGKPRN